MSVKQAIQVFLIIALLILLAWLAFWIVVIALVIGACVTAYLAVRRFLIDKGIINAPAPPSADPRGEGVEIIEVDYHEVKKDEAGS